MPSITTGTTSLTRWAFGTSATSLVSWLLVPSWPGPWHGVPLAQWQIDTSPAFAQADLVNDLGNKGYLVFGLILFVWELLPTTLLVGFFRVHRPPQDLVRASGEAWRWDSMGWGLGGLGEISGGKERTSTAAYSPRAPAASSMGRSLVPVPTSSTGLGTVKKKAAPGSMAGVRVPGRTPSPTSRPGLLHGAMGT